MNRDKIIQKNNKIDLTTILAVVILARIACPVLSNIPIFTMSFVFVYGVSFIFLFFFRKEMIRKTDMTLILSVMLYTIYIVFRSSLAGQSLFARDSFNAYIIFFLTFIYIWAKEQPLLKKVFLMKLIFAMLLFNYTYSIVVLCFDPNASRIAASIGVLEKSPYDILNAVGGFDAVYGGILVVVILLFMKKILKDRKIKSKTIFVILSLAVVFLVMASYATAIVLLVLAIALYCSSKNSKLSTLIILLGIIILVLHEPIGKGIMDLSKSISYSQMLRKKIDEFGYMFKTFESTGTYAGESGRFARFSWSWNTFKAYPLFGGIGISGAKVGGHSEILDLLGNFGFVGFFVVTFYLTCLYNNIKASLQYVELKKCLNIIMFVFVISSVLNPSLYSLQMIPIILMVYLATPYIEDRVEKCSTGDKK